MKKELTPLPKVESDDEVNSAKTHTLGETFNWREVLLPLDTMNHLSKPGTLTALSFGSAATLTSLATEKKDIDEKRKLLEKIESLSNALSKAQRDKENTESLFDQLLEVIAEFQNQEEIKYLQGKILKDAESKIRSEKIFFEEFKPGKSHKAFVLSIDIRSSTELMLHAKTPESYAKFLTGLCETLSSIIINNGGILDKFTGDGVLAFFPYFYSGDDVGYRAILSASDAIQFFEEHYRTYRNCFKVVIANTGLGVGIDYGIVNFVNIGESLSVVGTPVVYACRLSSTDAGTICVNQPAQELLNDKYKAQTVMEDTTLNIKGSGPIYVYKVRLKGDHLKPSELPWKQKPENKSISTNDLLPNTDSKESISQQ
jgi:class 3 adenylate cyclase